MQSWHNGEGGADMEAARGNTFLVGCVFQGTTVILIPPAMWEPASPLRSSVGGLSIFTQGCSIETLRDNVRHSYWHVQVFTSCSAHVPDFRRHIGLNKGCLRPHPSIVRLVEILTNSSLLPGWSGRCTLNCWSTAMLPCWHWAVGPGQTGTFVGMTGCFRWWGPLFCVCFVGWRSLWHWLDALMDVAMGYLRSRYDC